MEIERVVELIRKKQLGSKEGDLQWFKRDKIEELAKLDSIPRKDIRRTCKAAQKGEIEDQLQYVRFGHESYYYTPKTKARLPNKIRTKATEQEGHRFEKDAESNGLKDLILSQLNMAFDAAVHEKTDVVFAVTEYVVSQFYKGVIWLPLSLHPYVYFLLLREDALIIPPFKGLNIPLHPEDWKEGLRWLLEVQTQIAMQGGRYPPELGDVSKSELRKINELTFDVGCCLFEGCVTLSDVTIPELFEMNKRLVEGANIDLLGLDPPAIEWGMESSSVDTQNQEVARNWLAALFDFLNDNMGLWRDLARKRIAEEKQAAERLGIVGELTPPTFWKIHGVDESEASPEILDFNRRLRPPISEWQPEMDKIYGHLDDVEHPFYQDGTGSCEREPDGRRHRAKKKKED